MNKERIRIWVKNPGEPPAPVELPNELRALQQIVDGPIEAVTIAQDFIVVCNEEGLLRGLPDNCEICGVSFCGTVAIVGAAGEEFADACDAWTLRRLCPQLWARDPRTACVTWYRPEKKMPEEDVLVLATVTGRSGNVAFSRSLEFAAWNREDGWAVDGWPGTEDLQVHMWCEPPCEPDEEDLP